MNISGSIRVTPAPVCISTLWPLVLSFMLVEGLVKNFSPCLHICKLLNLYSLEYQNISACGNLWIWIWEEDIRVQITVVEVVQANSQSRELDGNDSWCSHPHLLHWTSSVHLLHPVSGIKQASSYIPGTCWHIFLHLCSM